MKPQGITVLVYLFHSFSNGGPMKGTIPRSFIDDLIARTDIVDLINQRVKLKKAGRDYQACCPFHHEKTPSFS